MPVINGKSLINDFFSLVYPRVCEACGDGLMRHEHFICTHCTVTLPQSGFHLSKNHEMAQVFWGRVPFETCGALYTYEKRGRVQRLLHSIKYKGGKELAEHLGAMYAESVGVSGAFSSVDCVIPIPLHEKKLRARGFNQSEWFARGFAKGVGKKLDTASMVRRVETSTQTRKKKYARWENVKGIFNVTEPAQLTDHHVLIIDDVITTGATLEAAWVALKNIPGIRVSAASIAFATRAT